MRRERDQLSDQLKNQTIIGGTTEDSISSEAIEILKAAPESTSGTILKPRSIGNRSIQVGKKSLGSEDSRDFAQYEDALEELISHGLVKSLGGKGEMFKLTSKGWQTADTFH